MIPLLLALLLLCGCSAQRIKIDFTCVGLPHSSGKLILECADEQSWREWREKQQQHYGF